MTDADLMDADCIHGRTWWECPQCAAEMDRDLAEPPAVEWHITDVDHH